jgi:hypothetical protein
MDAGVAIAVRDIDVAVRSNGRFGGPVEWRPSAHDAGRILAVIARLGADAGRAERQEEFTVGREFPDSVIAAIDDVKEVVCVDGQRMRLIGEDVFAKRGDERAVGFIDEAAGLEPGHREEAILGIDGDPNHIAMPPTSRELLPIGHHLIERRLRCLTKMCRHWCPPSLALIAVSRTDHSSEAASHSTRRDTRNRLLLAGC